jgi:tripartite-type tricarboxylate transporter receptor subunit TctC
LLGQLVIIDNRPGAGGHIGNALAAKAPTDGYTILGSAGSVLLSGVYRNLAYDPVNDLNKDAEKQKIIKDLQTVTK